MDGTTTKSHCHNEGAVKAAEAAVVAMLMAEANEREELLRQVERLKADNERLRWRHPSVLPRWEDLPNRLRLAMEDALDEDDRKIAGVLWKILKQEHDDRISQRLF